MIESDDRLSVYGRIGNDDVSRCCCGDCHFCEARGASAIALMHLSRLIPQNPPLLLSVVMANVFLNQRKADVSTLSTLRFYLESDFGELFARKFMQAAEEFRKCETIEEASAVAGKFPLSATA